MASLDKPKRIFDRDREWEALTQFVLSPTSALLLGTVTGRRRQGKTYLLQALAEQYGGFHFVADESTEKDALRQFATALGAYLGVGSQLSFASWDEAIPFLLDRSAGKLVVIDEFPYLVASTPALPSILQRELDARERPRADERSRLLLCGSAMAVMGSLLAERAPLRGRASLELVVQPFDYRTAASFWDIPDPKLAVLVHAIVGGTPAYRTRFVDYEGPASLADFDDWVARRVLSLAAPLLREGRYLLTNEAHAHHEALYHSLLGAIAAGNATRGGIANHMARKSTDLAHPLDVLEDCHLIRKESDPFRSNRSFYRIAEPLLAFYQAIMRPQWSRLDLGYGAEVWRDMERTFLSQVVGPHFEAMCRDFVVRRGDHLFGEAPSVVAAGTVNDPGDKAEIQVDVAALAPERSNERRRLLSVGEVKWGQTMTVGHLDRLRRAVDLLHRKGFDTRDTVLACYSSAGFDPELRQAADRGPVMLFDLDRIYHA